MIAFGWAVAAVGAALFVAALLWTLRANPGSRIPFYRNAEVVPAGTIPMRAVGAGLLVFGAGSLTATTGPWAFLVVLVAPVFALAAIILHNQDREPISLERRGTGTVIIEQESRSVPTAALLALSA